MAALDDVAPSEAGTATRRNLATCGRGRDTSGALVLVDTCTQEHQAFSELVAQPIAPLVRGYALEG